MGRSIHSLKGLCPPLSLIDERFMDMSAGLDLFFFNKFFKVLLFLEADHELIMEGHPPLSIRSGDLLIQPFPILQIYRASKKKADSRIHVLRILLDLPLPRNQKLSAKASHRSVGEDNLRGFLASHLSGIHYLPKFITPQIHEQITRLKEEVESQRSGYRFKVSHIAISLIVDAIRQLSPTVSKVIGIAPTKSAVAVARAKEYLVENLAHPLTLDQVAWHVRLSREHLARLFRLQTGQTVFGYLSNLRLETAKTHLCNPNLLVAEVARRSGFSSVPLFCRTFKRVLKMTPLEYRMQRMGEVRFSPSKYTKPASERPRERRNH